MTSSLRREQQPPSARSGVVLCADDFALTNGVSQAIVELAEAGRISATSAMTTTSHWPSHATWLARTRGQIAVGLHLNLTLGQPLTAMPKLAPDRQLPRVGVLTIHALARRIDPSELYAEIDRQLAAFESELGFPPDHVDGHQHVQILPIIRTVLMAVLVARYGKNPIKPLVRVPSDSLQHTLQRSGAWKKALVLNTLATGFRKAVHQAGFQCNDGFTGVTDFGPTAVERDFAAASTLVAPRHMIMCHPGYVDEELTQRDPVTIRRQRELETLKRTGLPIPIWQPNRTSSGSCIDWQQEWAPSQ